MLPLGSIIQKHNIAFYCYVEDAQLYLPLKPSNNWSFQNHFNCLEDIKCWMANNFLQLNESKAEVILFGLPDSTNSISHNLGSLSPSIKPHARNLGVILHSDKQINSVVKGSSFHLGNRTKIKPLLSIHDLEILKQAFISSRLL